MKTNSEEDYSGMDCQLSDNRFVGNMMMCNIGQGYNRMMWVTTNYQDSFKTPDSISEQNTFGHHTQTSQMPRIRLMKTRRIQL